jgi:L-alanine-DL-glutamate epimerase-like enolase superfamily enzyme
MTKIISAEVIELNIPFDDPGKGEGLFEGAWTSHDFALLRVETDNGLIGWGEGFSYFCRATVATLMRQSIIPALVGRDPADIDLILAELRQKLHIIGRYGITMFAISAADLALNDLNAKIAGVSLAEHLGGRKRENVAAYASLVRYADTGLVGELSAKAATEGFGMIKLHEIKLPYIEAARVAIGPDVALTDDVNCNWTEVQTNDWAGALRDVDLLWLEEPIFPPEDFAALARLRKSTGLAIATGENLCTAHQFGEMIAQGGADYVQPSVTKIGGLTETMETRRLANAAGLKIAHHAPYFGPGALATLQCLGAAEDEEYFEYLYVGREASLYGDTLTPKNGRIDIPLGPGLGFDPDPDVIGKFRV